MSLGNIGSERRNGKLTLARVRGRLTHNNNPVRMSKPYYREWVAMQFQSVRSQDCCVARVFPPCFEVVGIPPGKYRVTIAWMEKGRVAPQNEWAEVDKLDGRYAGDKTPFEFEVTDKNEVQFVNFDLKGDLRKPAFLPRRKPPG